MKVEVIFEEPRDITSPGLDGTVILFPFAVRRIGEGTLRNQISHHSVAVFISGTLRSIWGFGRIGVSDDSLVKTLFEFARQHIVRQIQQGELGEREKVDLLTNTAPRSNPYDPAKVPDPTGAIFGIEVQEEQSKLPELPSFEESRDMFEPPVEIQESLRRFKDDHPNLEKTAFIIMQFSNTPTHDRIVASIREVLASYGISALRADDKDYHDDLFSNILTYLYGSSFGIAVLERIESDEFNPNVSLEVGYMLALRKPVCLLKDRTLKALHSDLIGKLYKVFDPQDPQGTIPSVLSKWLRDRKLVKESEDKAPERHRYKCEYYGLQNDVSAFSKEAFDFGARNQVTRVHEDGSADIQFDYGGVYPSELFDQVARNYHLNAGLGSE